MPGHVHMLKLQSPKISMSQIIDDIKGKRAIHLPRL
ncbi:transposase [Methylomonas sp. 2B]